MARLTKKARRAAALKGWRNRKRNPSLRQRWAGFKAERAAGRSGVRALKPHARLNPVRRKVPSGFIPCKAVKITRNRGKVEVRIRK